MKINLKLLLFHCLCKFYVLNFVACIDLKIHTYTLLYNNNSKSIIPLQNMGTSQVFSIWPCFGNLFHLFSGFARFVCFSNDRPFSFDSCSPLAPIAFKLQPRCFHSNITCRSSVDVRQSFKLWSSYSDFD